MLTNRGRTVALSIGAVGLAVLLSPSRTLTAQAPLADLARIEAGTEIVVRTTEPIDVQSLDGRIYSAVVAQDVLESSTGRVVR